MILALNALYRMQDRFIQLFHRGWDQHGNLKPMSELTAEEASLVQGVEVFEEWEGRGDERRAVGLTKKIKLVSRLDAVKTLGAHFGMFAKKVEHTGKNGGPIESQTRILGDVMDLIDGSDTPGLRPRGASKPGRN